MTMPRVEFEGFKINLNSVLLLVQLGAICIGLGIAWSGSGAEVKANGKEIERMVASHEETRKELRELRTQATATAVLKADMDNLKSSMARIERALETRLK